MTRWRAARRNASTWPSRHRPPPRTPSPLATNCQRRRSALTLAVGPAARATPGVSSLRSQKSVPCTCDSRPAPNGVCSVALSATCPRSKGTTTQITVLWTMIASPFPHLFRIRILLPCACCVAHPHGHLLPHLHSRRSMRRAQRQLGSTRRGTSAQGKCGRATPKARCVGAWRSAPTEGQRRCRMRPSSCIVTGEVVLGEWSLGEVYSRPVCGGVAGSWSEARPTRRGPFGREAN